MLKLRDFWLIVAAVVLADAISAILYSGGLIYAVIVAVVGIAGGVLYVAFRDRRA